MSEGEALHGPHARAGSGNGEPPAVAGSQLLSTGFFSPVLGRWWRYSVYLPPDYERSKDCFPVLYLLHGRGGDETSWATEGAVQTLLDAEIGTFSVRPLLALMPDFGSSWCVDARERFETAFFADFLPHIATRYRTLEHRGARALAGYSMGGFGVLRYALTRPDLFGGAVLLSPAIYEDVPPAGSSARALPAFGEPFDPGCWRALNYPAALERLPSPAGCFFVASGDADYAHPDLRMNVEVQVALLHARLRGRGITSHLRVLPGGHDWSVWRPAFLEGVRLVLPGRHAR
ncbi:alpha/beta hydrolase [Deinococcus apachensis]|uniref:alpha/beta hydrolase n=1 Tax=Deinococcus apachensis TaxID=309886 RepID=UPI00036139D8|nr:alpha/beta hydrolase-fold protein [Deinococcus apachensis]